jgi:streptogramin lyase
MTKWLSGTAFVLAAAVIIDVGCASNPAGPPPPPPPPTLTPTQAPQSASITDPLTANVAEPIPALGGFSGTFKEAANNAPLAGTVSLTSYMHAPANAPAPQDVRRALLSGPRAPLAADSRTAIFWVSQTYSAPVTFNGFPITAWQVPSGLNGPFELETFDATTSGILDVEVDTSVNGTSVTFPGSSTTFTTIVGHTYWWELLTGPTPTPTPGTTPTPPPSMTPTPPPSMTPTPPPSMTPTPPPITEYALSAGSNPLGITLGPDGALWFTEYGPTNKIGRITLVGAITEFPIPAGPTPLAYGITTGPDGNLWFVENGRNMVTKLTTSGVFTEYPIPTASSAPTNIAQGPDGNLWFTEANGNNIGRISPAGSISEFAVPTAEAQPSGITRGPDGALWFTEANGSVGRITTTGVITEHGTGCCPVAITTGPDGNLWFAPILSPPFCSQARGGCGFAIGKITTAGIVSYYSYSRIGNSRGIVAGPDGNLWFTVSESSLIGRITTAGTVRQFGGLSGTDPRGITAGPSGDPHMWFTEFAGSKIGKIHI